jgi:hypothetical protein
MKRKIRVTESELINSIEKIVKEQSALLGFGNTNGFNNMGIGRPTEKYRELGETNGGGNYSINLYNDPSATQDGMGIFEDDDELNEWVDDRTWEDKIKDLSRGIPTPGNPYGWGTDGGEGGDRALARELNEGPYCPDGCPENHTCTWTGCEPNWSIDDYNFSKATDNTSGGESRGLSKEVNEFYDGRTWEDKIKDWEDPIGGWDDTVWWKTQQGGGDRAFDRELGEGGCGDGLEEGGCGDVQYESNLSRLVRNELLETQAKEAKKWIQGAVKRPGALRKKLGVRKGKDISLDMIDKKMKQIKTKDSNKKRKGVQGLTKADLRTYKQLNLAKSLRKMAKKKHASEAKRFKK